MASKALLETFLTKVSRPQSSFFLAGAVRKIHSDAVAVPEVPLSLHDPNYFFIVPEDGSPLKLFEPEIPEVNFNSILRFFKEIGPNSRELKTKLLQRTAEVDLFLISTQAFQTAKEMPSRFNNYFISYDGVISVEKIVPIEKLKTNVREAGSKLTEFKNKLPISEIQRKWEIVKGKLPAWQSTIATKLQNFQDAINKRINPKKPD